jgi:dTDP-4-dehydrorhamnose reductase
MSCRSSYWSANGVDWRGSGNVAQAASEIGACVVLVSSCFVTRQHRHADAHLKLQLPWLL